MTQFLQHVDFQMFYERYFVDSFEFKNSSDIKTLLKTTYDIACKDELNDYDMSKKLLETYAACETLLQKEFLSKSREDQKIHLEKYKEIRRIVQEKRVEARNMLKKIDDKKQDVINRLNSLEEMCKFMRKFDASKRHTVLDGWEYFEFVLLFNNLHDLDKDFFSWIMKDEEIKRRAYVLGSGIFEMRKIQVQY